MCGFKPGDEVVCVDDAPAAGVQPPLVEGRVYVVVSRGRDALAPDRWLSTTTVVLAGVPLSPTGHGWSASRFRKVERRNDSLSIEAFLTIKPGFEEPRRPKAPAKKRERA